MSGYGYARCVGGDGVVEDVCGGGDNNGMMN